MRESTTQVSQHLHIPRLLEAEAQQGWTNMRSGFYGQRFRMGSGSLSARSGAIFGGAIVSGDRSANKGTTIRNASSSRLIRARADSFSRRTSFISLIVWLIWPFAKITRTGD